MLLLRRPGKSESAKVGSPVVDAPRPERLRSVSRLIGASSHDASLAPAAETLGVAVEADSIAACVLRKVNFLLNPASYLTFVWGTDPSSVARLVPQLLRDLDRFSARVDAELPQYVIHMTSDGVRREYELLGYLRR